MRWTNIFAASGSVASRNFMAADINICSGCIQSCPKWCLRYSMLLVPKVHLLGLSARLTMALEHGCDLDNESPNAHR